MATPVFFGQYIVVIFELHMETPRDLIIRKLGKVLHGLLSPLSTMYMTQHLTLGCKARQPAHFLCRLSSSSGIIQTLKGGNIVDFAQSYPDS